MFQGWGCRHFGIFFYRTPWYGSAKQWNHLWWITLDQFQWIIGEDGNSEIFLWIFLFSISGVFVHRYHISTLYWRITKKKKEFKECSTIFSIGRNLFESMTIYFILGKSSHHQYNPQQCPMCFPFILRETKTHNWNKHIHCVKINAKLGHMYAFLRNQLKFSDKICKISLKFQKFYKITYLFPYQIWSNQWL